MTTTQSAVQVSAWKVFIIFLKLGLTSFGGPIAHLGYFREEFVDKQHWLSDESYADLVALCQFLPGPASSQVGIAIGLSKAGYRGAILAWLGFTLPSAIILIIFALGITVYSGFIASGVLQGLKIVAVAIVAQAVWGMGKSLCPDTKRMTMMVVTACFVLLIPSFFVSIMAIMFSGLLGVLLFKPDLSTQKSKFPVPISTREGVFWWLLFAGLFLLLPFVAVIFPNQIFSLIDLFYRAGSLVFGGGHVVLPLLQSEMIPSGLVSQDLFLAGYGATQAVPGPLFTFAAFLGTSMSGGVYGCVGGLIALIAIFLPSFFLLFGALPFWEILKYHAVTRAALMGINAAVVGILVAALYDPIWTSAILSVKDFSLALVAFMLLAFWRLPPWIVVIFCGVIGWLISLA